MRKTELKHPKAERLLSTKLMARLTCLSETTIRRLKREAAAEERGNQVSELTSLWDLSSNKST